MEEDTKHLQNLQSLDIKYLKSEKESLIKSNYAYSEQISHMEIEISDLKACLQASQNENLMLNNKVTRLHEDLVKNRQKSKESSKVEHESTEISKITAKNDEDLEDLCEEVNELRDENQYYKGEFIPKMENQLDNARMLIKELEQELAVLYQENEELKSSLADVQQASHSFRNTERKGSLKHVSEQTSKSNGIKGNLKIAKPKCKISNYVPSIKRIDKTTGLVECTTSISKR